MTAMERFVDDLVLSDPDSPRPIVMVSQLIIDAKIDASDTNAVRFVVAQHLLEQEPTLPSGGSRRAWLGRSSRQRRRQGIGIRPIPASPTTRAWGLG